MPHAAILFIGTKAVEQVQSVDLADGFLMELLRVGRLVKIEISAENLVCSLLPIRPS